MANEPKSKAVEKSGDAREDATPVVTGDVVETAEVTPQPQPTTDVVATDEVAVEQSDEATESTDYEPETLVREV